MTDALQDLDLHEFVDRLDDAQQQHLRLVISQDHELAAAAAPHARTNTNRPQTSDTFSKLIGSLTDAPADLRTNPRYVRERFERHGLLSQ